LRRRRAASGVALQDAGDERGFLDAGVLHRLAEVELRRRLHAVGAVPEVHLVAVEREDLFLGVALLDLHREQQLLHLAFPGLLVGEEQLAGELLRERAGAAGLAHLHQVGDHGAHQAGGAEAEVVEEVAVFRRQHGVAHHRRNLVVAQHHAPFGGELADHGVVAAEHARDGVGPVGVERRDRRQIVGVGEEDAARRAGQRGADEEQGESGVTRERGERSHGREAIVPPPSRA
jgi:hypothetical protein